jgi:hypothetical protein
VDIRDLKINGYKRLPLGSYAEGLINVKGSDAGPRVGVKRENDLIMHNMQKKRTSKNWRNDNKFNKGDSQ